MKKKHTSIKSIRNNYTKVFMTGYCNLQHIMKNMQPQYYNAGIYGWNCDIYVDYGRDIAITTGYRNTAGKRIPSEIIEKYSNIAKTIEAGIKKSVDVGKTLTEAIDEANEKYYKNIENFFEELDNLK